MQHFSETFSALRTAESFFDVNLVSEDQQQVSALKSSLSSLPCLFNSSDEGEDNSWDALDQVPYTFVKTVKSKKEKGEFSSLMT